MKFKSWLVSLLVFVAALTGVLATACNPETTEPPQEGPESGVYYYDGDGTEYLISLQNGNQFVFAVKDINTFGEYVLEGSVLTFNFSGDREPLTANLEGDALTLTLNGASMRFLKKIPYTVKFQSNGGSAVQDVTVINGKPLVKPNDPVRDGYDFAGWYSDEGLETLYNFESAVVTSNLTLYADWRKVVPGYTEFKISFNLGYSGAEEIAPVTTAGGQLSRLPKPAERSGFTFAGWWISMYEDADKLSYMYNSDIVFEENTTLFALWQSNESTGKTESPLVNVSNTAADWNSVGANVTYHYQLIGPEGNVIEDQTNGELSHSINFEAMPQGDYQIKVTALGATSSADSETTVRWYKNKALARVSIFTVAEPSNLIFNAVNNAQKYLITIDCGNEDHNHNPFDNRNSTQYNFAGCAMQEGGIKFTVTAVAEGYAPSQSATFVYERKLEAAQGLSVNSSTETLTWYPVTYATSYNVEVSFNNGQPVTYSTQNTSFSLKEFGAGEFELAVTPVCKGYNSPKAEVINYTKATLAAPVNVQLNGTMLTWDEVPEASSYTIRVAGQTFTSATNEYDLAQTQIDWQSGQDYVLNIRADGANNSMWSDDVDARYLALCQTLTYQSNVLSWWHVIGADKYEVRVNNSPNTKEVVGVNYAEVTLTAAGVNLLEVRYYVNGVASEWAQTQVIAYAVQFDSRSGSSIPTIYVATGDKITLPQSERAGYNFAGWYDSLGGASSNGALYGDDVFLDSKDIVLYAYWKARSYTIKYNYGDYGSGPESAQAVYNGYNNLAVPTQSAREGVVAFAGWFAGPGGTGLQYSDEKGNATTAYLVASDIELYAYWAEVLSYTKLSDGTYSVSKGPGVTLVSTVHIPATFDDGSGESQVTAMPTSAFKEVKTMVRVEIPDTIKDIALLTGSTGAFYNCSSLVELEVYNTGLNPDPTYISMNNMLIKHAKGENGAPYQLVYFPLAITGDVQIPNIVTRILPNVFKESKITSVTIPGTVIALESNAFYSCKNLMQVTIEPWVEVPQLNPSGEPMYDEDGNEIMLTPVLTLGAKVFYGCTALTQITLPARTSFEDGVTISSLFTSCSNLQRIDIEEGHPELRSVEGMVTDSTGTTLLYVPRGFSGVFQVPVGITAIGDSAVGSSGSSSACTKITEVIIPGYVTSIGRYAFAYISNLKQVTFKGGAVSALTLGERAFYYDTKLTTVTFEEGSMVTSLGAYCFGSNSALQQIILPPSLESIGNYAFSYCRALSSITLSASDKSLSFGTSVFNECTNLTTLYIPANVTEFSAGNFTGCTSLQTIEVDDANPVLTDINGVLFSKDESGVPVEILFYPYGVKGGYVIPDSVTVIGDYVFKDHLLLTSVSIGPNVTSIGNSAFSGCQNLTEIVFRKNENPTEDSSATLTIGNYAFEMTSADIVIPDNTVSIGKYAFRMSNIASVYIPKNVTLGTGVFVKCEKLTSVTLEDGIESIPEEAFMGCVSLSEIVIPASVSEIGEDAFGYCTILKKVTFKKNESGAEVPLDFKGSRTFADSGVEEIVLPARTQSVGTHMFVFCTALKKVIFEPGAKITEFGQNFFFKCISLEEVTIPATVTNIAQGAFSGLKSLKKITFESGGTQPLTIANGTSGSGEQLPGSGFLSSVGPVEEIILPARLVSLGNYAFSGSDFGYPAAKKISFEARPQGSEFANLTIGTYFGYHNDGLQQIELPDYLTKVGNYFLRYATGLQQLTIPSSLTDIGTYFLADCTGLQHLTLSNSIQSIPSNFLYNCTSIKDFTIPQSENATLATIDGIIYGMTDGKPTSVVLVPSGITGTVTIPYTVTSIGASSFQNCASLEEIKFAEPEEGVEAPELTIGGTTTTTSAFRGAGIQRIVLPDRLKTIPNCAFYQCTQLQSITIPASVTTIGTQVFYHCDSLVEVNFLEPEDGQQAQALTITNATSTTNGTFAYCIALQSITLPNRLANLSGYLFYQCAMLHDVTFPAKLNTTASTVSAGSGIFYGCTALEEVVLPSNITAMNTSTSASSNTFYNCKSLKHVTLPVSLTASFVATAQFSGCTALEEIILDESAANWKVVEGVLFNKAQTTLVYYPLGKLTTTYKIPEGVTTVNANSFSTRTSTSSSSGAVGATYLKNLTISKTVTSIGNYAFADMPLLETVTFEPGGAADLKITGNAVFANNVNLLTVVLPTRLTSIGTELFADCELLNSVTFEDDTTKMSTFGNKGLFSNCASLTSFTFPKGVTGFSTATNIFSNTSILSLDIPNGVTSLPKQFLSGNKVITRVTLPQSVQSVGDYAFQTCNSLTEVNLPEGIPSIGNYVFHNCSSLATLNIPTTVTSVGNYAFYGCALLEEIDIPANATIGTQAFAGSGIKEFTIPAGTETISASMFSNCANLQSIVIPQSVTKIEALAFRNCTSLTGITIPASVTSIANNSFTGCENLAEVVFEDGKDALTIAAGTATASTFQNCGIVDLVLPARLHTINNYTFANLPNLKTVKFNEGAEAVTIGSYAFANNPMLESVQLSSNVTSIGTYAFMDATSLSSVDLLEGLLTIGDYAFQGCTALPSIVIPSTVTSIGKGVLEGVQSFTVEQGNSSYVFEDGVLYDGSMSTILMATANKSGKYQMPEYVTTITQGAFVNSAITEVVFSEALTEIPAEAFKGSALQTLTIGKYITSIGANAFENCASLTAVNFEGDRAENLTLGASVFAGCTSLTSITLPEEKLQAVSDSAFENSGLESVELGGATSIGASAFKGTKLSSVTIGTSVQSVGANAFQGLSTLTQLTFEPGGTAWLTIGDYAFAETSLQSVQIPFRTRGYNYFLQPTNTNNYNQDYYNGIGAHAFESCLQLSSLTFEQGEESSIPSMLNLGDYAFAGDVSLTEVHFPKQLGDLYYSKDGYYIYTIPALGANVFENCTQLSTVTFQTNPFSSIHFGANAFAGCTHLANVTLPENLFEISEGMFSDAGLTELTIPQSVTSIGANAFKNCTKLTKLTIPAAVDTVGEGAFSGWKDGQTITVIGKTADTLPSGWAEGWDADCKAAVDYSPAD